MGLDLEQEELLCAFLSARKGTPHDEVERAKLAAILPARVSEAHRAWATLHWPDSHRVFARYLGELLADERADVAAILAELHVDDLLLVCACISRVPSALETFDKRFLRDLGPSSDFLLRSVSVDDLRQIVLEKLLVDDGSSHAKIRSYSGRGRLANWVAVAARRTALSLARRKGPPLETLSTSDLQQAMMASPNCEVAYMKAEHRAELQEAFRTALGELAERDRLILRLHLVDGITLDRIGVVYGVSPSSVSRWLGAARATVRARVECALAEQFGLDPEEVLSATGLVASDFDLSLARLLGG